MKSRFQLIVQHNDDGVLLAHGGSESGYTIYIKNNKVIYEYRIGQRGYKIVSNIDVPVGKSVISFKFAKTGSYKGMGSLYINETKVGETAIEKYIAVQINF